MESSVTPQNALEEALRRAGSQSALARILGIKQPSVHKALRAKRQVSAEEAVVLERELGIPRHESRPDLFQPDPAPAADAGALVEANR